MALHGVFTTTMLGALAVPVRITLGGLGFREAAVAYSAPMLGGTPGVAFSVAVLDRLVMTVCILVVAEFAIWRLIRPMSV